MLRGKKWKDMIKYVFDVFYCCLLVFHKFLKLSESTHAWENLLLEDNSCCNGRDPPEQTVKHYFFFISINILPKGFSLFGGFFLNLCTTCIISSWRLLDKSEIERRQLLPESSLLYHQWSPVSSACPAPSWGPSSHCSSATHCTSHQRLWRESQEQGSS